MRSHVPVALFTSAEKMQSKSKYRRFAMVLLAFLRERTFCCISPRAALYLFVVARVGAFSHNFCEVSNSFARVDQLQSEQIFH